MIFFLLNYYHPGSWRWPWISCRNWLWRGRPGWGWRAIGGGWSSTSRAIRISVGSIFTPKGLPILPFHSFGYLMKETIQFLLGIDINNFLNLMNWPYPGQDIAIPDARYNQTVYVFRCERSTVRVSGKCKSIILDGCEKTAVVFDDVATTCEFVNCRSVQMQVCDKEFLWKALSSKFFAIFVQ